MPPPTLVSPAPAPIATAAGEDVVCQCHGIGRARIEALCEDHDVEGIRTLTGAGTSCGGCVPLIGEIAGTQSLAPVILAERTCLDRHHAAFLFRSTCPETRAAFASARSLCCPDVLLERRDGARRVRRSYTVTQITPDGDIELIIRREPNGVMSRWLHDFAPVGTSIGTSDILRMSTPFGGLSVGAAERMVFRAGGIGITPALSWLAWRSEATDGPARCDIAWWARFEPESDLIARLDEAAWRARQAGCAVHLTRIDTTRPGGRPDASFWADWIAHAADTNSDHIHVCGPAGFMDVAAQALDRAGWPRARRSLESFFAAPGAGAGAQETARHRIEVFDAHGDPVICDSFHLRPARDRAEMFHEATAFLRQFYFEEGAEAPFETRLEEVRRAIEATGAYEQTQAEMAWGARVAWRNSARCIGRFFWKSLGVRDRRAVGAPTDAQLAHAVFNEILAHLAEGTNGGDLRATITVFRPDQPALPRIRILNPQVILYAGHRQADGSILGDPKSVQLTDLARALGWQPAGTRFDILPLMIRIGEGVPYLFELPEDAVLEVAMHHPEIASVADLGLKWFAVPAVSDLALDMGGLVYPAAPSNGFYMSTEIGSFNLADPARYDQMDAIAAKLGLDTGEDNPLWRDRAVVELNRMVLHSFRQAGVRIMDHHALSTWFDRFRADEATNGRPVYGHWPWIVPPMSANLSRVWHDSRLKKVILKPNYFYPARDAEISAALALARGLETGTGPS